MELAAEDSSDSDQQQQLDLDNVLEDNLDDIEGVVGQCSALLRRTKEAETTASAVADQDPLDKVLITIFLHGKIKQILQGCPRTWCPLDHTLRHS